MSKNGQLRCRHVAGANTVDLATMRPEPAPGQTKYLEVVHFEGGFCALRTDFSVTCWSAPMGNALQETFLFPGAYVQLVSGEHQVCALSIKGQMRCARSRRKVEGKPRIIRAVTVSSGPHERLVATSGIICALDEQGQTCTRDVAFSDQTYVGMGNGHVRIEVKDHEDKASAYRVVRYDGMATRDRVFLRHDGECRIDAEGAFSCVSSQYPKLASLFPGGRYTQLLTSGGEVCARNEALGWFCTPRVRAARMLSGNHETSLTYTHKPIGLVLQGLDDTGHWVVANELEPSTKRHDFVQLHATLSTTCGLRKDDTVRCVGRFSYDDDALIDVEHISSWAHGFETSRGVVGDIHERQRCLEEREHASENRKYADYVYVTWGERFGCGLHQTGEVECWGVEKQAVFPRPSSKERFVRVAIAGRTLCGVERARGRVLCWDDGSKKKGQQGARVMFEEKGGYVALEASAKNFCAMRKDDTVQCWGQMFEGVFELPFKTKQFAVLSSGVCAVHPERRDVQCWGEGVLW